MSASDRDFERVTVTNGLKFLKLKSGRFVSFWNMLDAAESAHTDLARCLSRAFKLAGDDYDLERLEWFVERLEGHTHALRHEIEKRRGIKTREERIALLRNTSGRTPEEAAAYRAKADALEAAMRQDVADAE